VKKHSKEWWAIHKANIALERVTRKANTDIEDAVYDLSDALAVYYLKQENL
jgi:hypothetical protein